MTKVKIELVRNFQKDNISSGHSITPLNNLELILLSHYCPPHIERVCTLKESE